MTDLRLLTPFSNETRHSGFLQGFVNTFPTPAMCAHRPPTHANGLTRALTASKYSPFHCRDVVSPCLRGPRYYFPEHLDVSKFDETVTWQERTYVLVLFSFASKHIPLHLREVVRSPEVVRTLRSFETSNTLTTRSIFSGLKGWEDIEVDNVKPQEIVSSLPLVTA